MHENTCKLVCKSLVSVLNNTKIEDGLRQRLDIMWVLFSFINKDSVVANLDASKITLSSSVVDFLELVLHCLPDPMEIVVKIYSWSRVSFPLTLKSKWSFENMPAPTNGTNKNTYC